jgi:hypothetical protein
MTLSRKLLRSGNVIKVAVVVAADVDVVVVVATMEDVVKHLGREDFNSLSNAMTAEERKRHMDEGLCFKCHKKGHRLFQCPEFKGKAPLEPKKQ